MPTCLNSDTAINTTEMNKEPFVKFVGRDGSEFDMFFKGRLQPSLYFSDELKKALGLPLDFPQELTLNPKPSIYLFLRSISVRVDH